MSAPLYRKDWQKRLFLSFTAAVLLVGGLFLYLKILKRQYNVILISVDTLRQDHMGVYGYKKETTPNIDAWAKQATIFTNARTVVPFTYPSFAALMTGLHPLRTRIIMNAVSAPVGSQTATLATYLKKEGYNTAAFVTNRFIETKYSGLNQGFNTFKEFDAFGKWKKDRTGYNAYLNKAMQWLRQNKDKKFFLWVHLMDPHYPYFPNDKEVCNNIPEACQQMSGQTLEDVEQRGKAIFSFTEQGADASTAAYFRNLYDGDVSIADSQVGKMLQAIRQWGLENNTLVIFLGDHGEGLDHNYYLTHGEALYESSVRIPLIIRYPGQKEQFFVPENITNTDVLPTVLGLLRIPYQEKSFDGKSRRLPIEGGTSKPVAGDSSYLMNLNGSQFAVVSGAFKYVYSKPNARGTNGVYEALYNMADDPGELNNIAKENSAVAERLKEQLFATIDAYDYPVNATDTPYPNTAVINALKALQY